MSEYPLVPYEAGELVPVAGPGTGLVYGRDEVPIIIDIPGPPPEKDPSVPDWFGKMKEEQEEAKAKEPEESEFMARMRKKAERYGYPPPENEEEAREYEKFFKAMEDLTDAEAQATLEKWRAYKRGYEAKYKKPAKFERFLKATGRVWKGVKAVTVPGKPHPQWYIPKAMPEYYVPGGRVRKLTDPTGAPAGYMHTPHLHSLQRAGAPPPTAAVKAPFRDVERFEGLGTAMGRLRELERFPSVDQAVYAEIHANGDIDTPSHVRREVGQLGFSRSEIDIALKRLREAGLVTPSGRVHEGETELMIVGGQ